MINQNPLTVLAAIDPQKLPALKLLLQTISDKVESNAIIPFGNLTKIHFARFVIIDAAEVDGKATPAWLSFSSNFDGDLDGHLTELFAGAGAGFDQVDSNCLDYRASGNTGLRIAFFKEHMLPLPNAFYVGHRGLSVETIKHQDKVRDEIETFLNQNPQGNLQPLAIKQNIVQHLQKTGLLNVQPPAIHLGSIWQPLLVVLVIIILAIALLGWKSLWLLVALIVVVLFLYATLRQKEKSDPQIEIKDEQTLTDKIATLKTKEDFVVQNQLTHLVEIKKGWFRLLSLRFVLWAINLLAKTVYTKGKLGNIPTIHFARWVIIDNNRRLLFFSNFDGSWESYLGDFIDKAAVGLTGVWSNTELFPKTKNLISNGATDEERFKYWTRKHQIPTQVWYSAYKTLSVVNVINNNEIHQGLFKKMNHDETIAWLRKL